MLCQLNIACIEGKRKENVSASLLQAQSHSICLLSSKQSMKMERCVTFPNEGKGLQDQVFHKIHSIILMVIFNGKTNSMEVLVDITIGNHLSRTSNSLNKVGRNLNRTGNSLSKVGNNLSRASSILSKGGSSLTKGGNSLIKVGSTPSKGCSNHKIGQTNQTSKL